MKIFLLHGILLKNEIGYKTYKPGKNYKTQLRSLMQFMDYDPARFPNNPNKK